MAHKIVLENTVDKVTITTFLENSDYHLLLVKRNAAGGVVWTEQFNLFFYINDPKKELSRAVHLTALGSIKNGDPLSVTKKKILEKISQIERNGFKL